MNWLWLTLVIVYVLGFLGVFAINIMCPVTPGLAYARALVWPVYILFGWPEGEREPMD
jgi:hypothetical protein